MSSKACRDHPKEVPGGRFPPFGSTIHIALNAKFLRFAVIAFWVASTAVETRDFAIAYEQLASEILRDVKVWPSTNGPQSITRIFGVMNIPELPGMKVRHEFGNQLAWKYTNIQFPLRASQVEVLRSSALLKRTLYQVETAGQSLSIRARTPGVNPMRPIEEEQDKVEAGLIATRDLLAWIRACGRYRPRS